MNDISKLAKAPNRICILMDGGVVHSVLTDPGATALDAYVLDYDTEGADEDTLTTVRNRVSGKSREVYVGTVETTDHADIDLSDVFKGNPEARVFEPGDSAVDNGIGLQAATTALCVAEEIAEAHLVREKHPHCQALVDHVNAVRKPIGSVELRSRQVAFAENLENAWTTFSEDEREDILEHIGCFDFEWVPAMMYGLLEECEPMGLSIFDADTRDIVRLTRAILAESAPAASPAM